jgi:excisionase family DNA binding protein
MSTQPPQSSDLGERMVALLEMPARLSSLEAEVCALRQTVAELRRALPPTLASLPEAANRLGVSLSTIRREVKRGTLPSVRVGRSVRIDLGLLRPPDEERVVRLASAARRGQ